VPSHSRSSDENTEIQHTGNWYDADLQSATEASQGAVQPHRNPSRSSDSSVVRARREDSSKIDADLIRDTPRIDPRLAAALVDAQNFRAMPVFIPDPFKVLSLRDIISPLSKATKPSVSFLNWPELGKGSSIHKIQRGIPPEAPASGDQIINNRSSNMPKAPSSGPRARFHPKDNAIELTTTQLDGLRREHKRINEQAPTLRQAPKCQALASQRAVKTVKCTSSPLRIQPPSERPIAYIPQKNTNPVSRFFKDGKPVGFVLGWGKVNAKYMLTVLRTHGLFPPPPSRQLSGTLFGKSTLTPKLPSLPSQTPQPARRSELWGGESLDVCCSGGVETGISTPELTEDDGSSSDEEVESDHYRDCELGFGKDGLFEAGRMR
jgi:hypothetical protein